MPKVPLFNLSDDEGTAFQMDIEMPQDHEQNPAHESVHEISLSQCRFESQFSRLRAGSDTSSSAPSDLTSWSTMTPSEPGSASGLMASKLADKEKQLESVNKTLNEFRKKLAALEAELTATKKKRPRESGDKSMSEVADAAEECNLVTAQPPNKKLSPEAPRPTKSHAPKSPELAPAASATGREEEEPPSPEKAINIPLKPPALHESLESIVCAYREGGFRPGVGNMTFAICVDLIKDEIARVNKWDRPQTKKMQPAIISALKLIYPKRGARWDQHECARSPSAAKKYWQKVLTKWRDMWAREMMPQTPAASKSSPTMDAITKRIRDKIKARASAKASPTSLPKRGAQPIPIVISDSDSSGCEDVADKVGAASASAEKQSAKLAPGPDKYTHQEMKSFAKMVCSMLDLTWFTYVSTACTRCDNYRLRRLGTRQAASLSRQPRLMSSTLSSQTTRAARRGCYIHQ